MATIANPEFSIQKALEFVGDNSSYQKRKLFLLSAVIVVFATFNCRIPFMGQNLAVFFLFSSGLGQIICPVYFNLRIVSLLLALCCLLSMIFYPFSSFFLELAYCGLGFFGRGFYTNSIIYLSQIGGDKFRAWSTVVVLVLWGVSPFFLSFESILKFSPVLWMYLMVFAPFLVSIGFVLREWKPSPLKLHSKRLFDEAKQVLNDMARENNRSDLPYGLEGEQDTDEIAMYSHKKLNYLDLVHRQSLWAITVPLGVFWIYREYIYYGLYILVPEMGQQVSKNLILFSASETVAVLMSYPIKLKIKRVNAFFGFTLLITLCCLASSFTTLGEECMEKGFSCASKYIYRFSTMSIRFSISLVSSILINYTLEIYPSNARSLGFAFCLGLSSLGSTILPWMIRTFIYVNLSGFIGFFVASLIALYFITKMEETHGKMRNESVEQYEENRPLVSLANWATLRFG